MKDLKYLLAYSAPISALLAIYFQGWWSFAALYYAFGIIPVLEFFLPGTTVNHKENEEAERDANPIFNIMLYSNLPLLYAILIWGAYTITFGSLETYEIVGITVSMGITCGVLGINVAHELGHRETWYEQLMAKMMLLSSLYIHFFIEHNRGHHKNVSTDEDPASARLNESAYAFFMRSVTGSYIGAWALEAERLKREGKSALSVSNEMIWYQIVQAAYLITIYLVFGLQTMLYMVLAAVIGFLLLELVNYIEHYGLRRKKLESGRYEKVMPYHSWNSNHEVGRIVLYELTRHSDHHYKATRKYQILRHFDESPQLPLGYPGSMLLALLPPLWFWYMNEKVAKFNQTV